MGNPKPVSVTGVSRTELAHKQGAFSIWGGAIPQEMNVEEFASAFVRSTSRTVLDGFGIIRSDQASAALSELALSSSAKRASF